MESDIFISHASEDKETVARPLAQMLNNRGYNVWFDEFVLSMGDSLRRAIDSGLASCRYGVVVLSHNFFNKQWPQRELDGLAAREIASGEKLILPVWHEISHAEILNYSPMMADKIGISTDRGIEFLAERIAMVVGGSIGREQVQEIERPLMISMDERSIEAELYNNVVEAEESGCPNCGSKVIVDHCPTETGWVASATCPNCHWEQTYFSF